MRYIIKLAFSLSILIALVQSVSAAESNFRDLKGNIIEKGKLNIALKTPINTEPLTGGGSQERSSSGGGRIPTSRIGFIIKIIVDSVFILDDLSKVDIKDVCNELNQKKFYGKYSVVSDNEDIGNKVIGYLSQSCNNMDFRFVSTTKYYDLNLAESKDSHEVAIIKEN